MDQRDEDRAALEDFCRLQFPRLVALLSIYCGDPATAEDLAQETLARVWRRWDRVRRLDAPELWARRVALNLANSWFRRRRAGARAVGRAAAFVAPAPAPAGDDGFLRLVAGLAPRQRAALVLRFHEDLSVAETARLLRCREGTVKALTSQALDALRRQGVAVEDADG
ncbi:MAG TPA: sigma factor [Acidimicrobiales bacterium]|nr:sigma factor [Acidimicrobiales bacterium]